MWERFGSATRTLMPTSKILLLGAGFSHNWDAPLASEVANSLLHAVGGDAYLQDVLKRHEKNFENALSDIQREYISAASSLEAKARLDKLQDAIAAMFERLNASFEPPAPFEFSNDVHYSIAGFLARFDAIFNLNQDVLLDLRYAQQVLSASNTRWNGLEMPGMRPVPDPALTGIADSHKRLWTPASPPYSTTPRFQPHFKIHGSSNWYTSDGRRLLVMGGNKEAMIREHPVLHWYYDEFSRRLMTGSTKLMVMGYSFSDRHVNEAITGAWQKGNLVGMFLVDPAGWYVLNPTPLHHIKVPNGLEEIRRLGGSTRPISTTFAGDALEHPKLMDFFRDDQQKT
jgi:hypothetical protein